MKYDMIPVHNQSQTLQSKMRIWKKSDLLDSILENLGRPCGLDDNIEAIWVIILQLLELNLGVLTREFNIGLSLS